MPESQWENPTEPVNGIEAFDEAATSRIAAIGRLAKRVGRLSRLTGQAKDLNLFDAARLLKDSSQALAELTFEVDALAEVIANTRLAPTAEWEARWNEEFEQALADLNIRPEGRYPSYQIFPFSVHVDLPNDAATVHERLTHVVRPRELAKLVQKERDKLFGARFNERQFMKALATVYDLLQSQETRSDFGVSLKKTYDLLSLRTGSAGYSLRLFAFDLYRLRYNTDMTYEGRRFVLNPSRSARGSIPVPNPSGVVENLGSFEMVEV